MISSKYFQWDGKSKTFTAEASELPKSFDWERVYPDSCDEGFTMMSQATGDSATFFINSVDRDADGDVETWVSLPTPETVRKHPRLKNAKVIIFND